MYRHQPLIALIQHHGRPDAQGKGKTKIPTIKQLNQEYARVLSGKKVAYAEYREARKQMQEYLIAQKNVEAILGADQMQEEQQRQQEQQHNQSR